MLQQVHRFGGGIAALAEAVRRGDADAAIAVLAAGHDDVTWIPADLATRGGRRRVAVGGPHGGGHGGRGHRRGRPGRRRPRRPRGARRLPAAVRPPARPVRRGDLERQVEAWLAASVPGFGADGAWYVGRPLLVTENDYALRLYNGDTGVVVAAGPERLTAVFERRGQSSSSAPPACRRSRPSTP